MVLTTEQRAELLKVISFLYNNEETGTCWDAAIDVIEGLMKGEEMDREVMEKLQIAKEMRGEKMNKYEILEGRWDWVKDLTDVMELARKEADMEDNLYNKGLIENAIGCLGAALFILQDRRVLPQFGE